MCSDNCPPTPTRPKGIKGHLSQAVHPLSGAALNQIFTSRYQLPAALTQPGLPEAGAGLASQGSSPAPSTAKKASHIHLEASLLISTQALLPVDHAS